MADIHSILKGRGNAAGVRRTDTEEIRRIHYKHLLPNPKQFYSLRSARALADLIETSGGILQPLRVRQADAEDYEIIAGHKRREAARILAEERGLAQYALVPCVVERKASDVMAEFQLICTNAYPGKSDYEKMMEVARLNEIVPRLPGNEDVKGRALRAIVSQEYGMSETNIARYTKVYKDLCQEGMALFRDEKFGISIAYELARLSREEQAQIIKGPGEAPPAISLSCIAAFRSRKRAREAAEAAGARKAGKGGGETGTGPADEDIQAFYDQEGFSPDDPIDAASLKEKYHNCGSFCDGFSYAGRWNGIYINGRKEITYAQLARRLKEIQKRKAEAGSPAPDIPGGGGTGRDDPRLPGTNAEGTDRLEEDPGAEDEVSDPGMEARGPAGKTGEADPETYNSRDVYRLLEESRKTLNIYRDAYKDGLKASALQEQGILTDALVLLYKYVRNKEAEYGTL